MQSNDLIFEFARIIFECWEYLLFHVQVFYSFAYRGFGVNL